MSITSKRLSLHIFLAIGCFLGLGFVGVPGPHGGLAIMLPHLLRSLVPTEANFISFLLVYPPLIVLIVAGLIKKDFLRIVISHITASILTLYYVILIQRVYPPVRHIAFITGALFLGSIIASFVLPLICFRKSSSKFSISIILEFVTIAVLTLSIGCFILFRQIPKEKIPLKIHTCESNLELIGQLLKFYVKSNYRVNSNYKYPSPDKWCELLLEETINIENRLFTCPEAGNGRSHYAINPKATPTSPSEIVLVFETKKGWNQHGGLEILNSDYHGKAGSYILFNDKHVEFVPVERFAELKWDSE